jgi:hypothetical protein
VPTAYRPQLAVLYTFVGATASPTEKIAATGAHNKAGPQAPPAVSAFFPLARPILIPAKALVWALPMPQVVLPKG